MEQWAVHILLLKYSEQPRKATPKEKLEEEYKQENPKQIRKCPRTKAYN